MNSPEITPGVPNTSCLASGAAHPAINKKHSDSNDIIERILIAVLQINVLQISEIQATHQPKPLQLLHYAKQPLCK